MQLSRLGVVQGLGEVVGEEARAGAGGSREDEEDGNASLLYAQSLLALSFPLNSTGAGGSEKLVTAQDFADITELAEEEEKERLFQKGVMFVQTQTGQYHFTHSLFS